MKSYEKKISPNVDTPVKNNHRTCNPIKIRQGNLFLVQIARKIIQKV